MLLQQIDPSFAARDSAIRYEQARIATLWGIAPVAPVHLGLDVFLVNLRKLATPAVVLLADSQLNLFRELGAKESKQRADYYADYIYATCGDRVQVRRTSEFFATAEYTSLLMECMKAVRAGQAKQAIPASLARSNQADRLIVLMAGVMQCADALYLQPARLFADRSQAKAYSLLPDIALYVLPSGEGLPDLHYIEPPIDIQGYTIFRSSSASRIEVHDTPSVLKAKVRAMYAPPAGHPIPEGRRNALVDAFAWSVFPWLTAPIEFKLESGRTVGCESFADYLRLYESGDLHPVSCKLALESALNTRLAALRRRLNPALATWIKPT